MGRPCCCDCCTCEIFDQELSDTDVTEYFYHLGSTGPDDASVQDTGEGSILHGCNAGVEGDPSPPSRHVTLSGVANGGYTRYFASFTVAGVTGTAAATLNGSYTGAWSSPRYNINRDYTVYASIVDDGTDLVLRIRRLGTTIYKVASAAMPLAGATVFSYISTTEPNTATWPATLTVTVSSSAGTAVNNEWYRIYEATEFTPDGSDGPRLSLRMDYLQSLLGGLTLTPGLAMRQGDVLCHSSFGGTGYDEWWRSDFGGSDVKECYWDFAEWDGYWLIAGRSLYSSGAGDSYIPDLTSGAPPIAFGIHLDGHFFLDGPQDIWIDNVCLRIADAL